MESLVLQSQRSSVLRWVGVAGCHPPSVDVTRDRRVGTCPAKSCVVWPEYKCERSWSSEKIRSTGAGRSR